MAGRLYLVNMQGDDQYYENAKEGFSAGAARSSPATSWGAMGIRCST